MLRQFVQKVSGTVSEPFKVIKQVKRGETSHFRVLFDETKQPVEFTMIGDVVRFNSYGHWYDLDDQYGRLLLEAVINTLKNEKSNN